MLPLRRRWRYVPGYSLAEPVVELEELVPCEEVLVPEVSVLPDFELVELESEPLLVELVFEDEEPESLDELVLLVSEELFLDEVSELEAVEPEFEDEFVPVVSEEPLVEVPEFFEELDVLSLVLLFVLVEELVPEELLSVEVEESVEDVSSVVAASCLVSAASSVVLLSVSSWVGAEATKVVLVPRPLPAVAVLITAAPIATAAMAATVAMMTAMRFWRLSCWLAASRMDSEAMRVPSGPIS